MSTKASGAKPGNQRPDPRARVALLVPSSNTVMENDVHAALPKDRVTVHTARMYLTETTPAAEQRMIERDAPKAAADLGTLNPDVLVFGCTSAGAEIFTTKRPRVPRTPRISFARCARIFLLGDLCALVVKTSVPADGKILQERVR